MPARSLWEGCRQTQQRVRHRQRQRQQLKLSPQLQLEPSLLAAACLRPALRSLFLTCPCAALPCVSPLPADEFRAYFSQYGEVVEAQIMQDHMSGRSRGFGWVGGSKAEGSICPLRAVAAAACRMPLLDKWPGSQ